MMLLADNSGPREPVHIALCERDDCPWKHRGVTAEATMQKAHQHAALNGHSITVYEDHTKVGRVL